MMAGVGAMGASHTLAAMLRAVPSHAPGCRQCKPCQCWPVACAGVCCNENQGLLQNKTSSLPKLLVRSSRVGRRAMPGSEAWGWGGS